MSNFEEFYVMPDDENDQVKVTWAPKEGVAIKQYHLEKSSDNEHFTVWKKTKGLKEGSVTSKHLEVDFEPFSGWSYYRIREVTASGETNYTPAIPVFIGLENLQKGVKIQAKTWVRDTRQKVSLSEFDGKSFILVLRDQNGDEFLYDKPIRANEVGLYVEPGSGIPKGPYLITASSLEKLIGMKILVY